MNQTATPPVWRDILQLCPKVPTGGYAWWYFDGQSSDGHYSFVSIALVGNVFSPYYARVRRRQPDAGNPWRFCAFNLALYGPTQLWVLSESAGLSDHDGLWIGHNQVYWNDNTLKILINDITAPRGKPVIGQLRIVPRITPQPTLLALHPNRQHMWTPWAPQSQFELQLSQPKCHIRGHGYCDFNWGSTALEQDFVMWHWQRRQTKQATCIDYQVYPRQHCSRVLHVQAPAQGPLSVQTYPQALLRRGNSAWGLPQWWFPPAPPRHQPAKRLEDTPFYSRSMQQDADGHTMHEHLDLRRFAAPWVQNLLLFRMHRTG